MVDDQQHFKYFFLALGASIHGWKHCRPVISVDGTFLKGKYRDTLLLATAQDGDNHLFPLAMAIVDSENDKSWHWFLSQLRYAYGVRDEMVIVSDRNSSIPKAVHSVFPECKYAICMQHLWSNMKSKFGKSYIQPLFYNCAKAYTVKQYEYWRGLLVAGNTRIEKYIDDANPQLWARCMFPGRRFNLMTTNISECLNSVLKEARGWPVACLVLSFRSLLQRWFNEKIDLIPLMVFRLTGKVLKLFTKVEVDACTINVSNTV